MVVELTACVNACDLDLDLWRGGSDRTRALTKVGLSSWLSRAWTSMAAGPPIESWCLLSLSFPQSFLLHLPWGVLPMLDSWFWCENFRFRLLSWTGTTRWFLFMLSKFPGSPYLFLQILFGSNSFVYSCRSWQWKCRLGLCLAMIHLLGMLYVSLCTTYCSRLQILHAPHFEVVGIKCMLIRKRNRDGGVNFCLQ
jgi:hypothetical protein